MNEDRSLELRFRSHLGDVRLAVAAVGGACERSGLSEHESGLVALALAEVLNNVVLHALSGRDTEEVLVQLGLSLEQVTVIVRDRGVAMPETAPAAAAEFDPDDTATLPEGGFGRGLVRHLMSEVRYERVNGVNVTTLVRRLRREREAA